MKRRLAITAKPKVFHLIYDSGVSGEFCDPVTGKPWFRLGWRAIKASMVELASRSHEDLSLVDDRTGRFITVTPNGCWR